MSSLLRTVERRKDERLIEVPEGERPFTDQGNAERLARRFGGQIVYVQGHGWYVWSPEVGSWVRDPEEHAIVHRAVLSARLLGESDNEDVQKFALKAESESALRAAVRLAAGVPGMSVEAASLDADPYLLNLPDRNVLVLDAQRIREAEPSDLLTMRSGAHYSLASRSVLWEDVVRRLFPDPEVGAFVQRAAGYSLTGDVSEEVMFIVYGVAAAGKNTFMETVLSAMGAYASTAAPSLLTRRRGSETIPTDVADLQGRRLVWANEASDASLLDEEKVKRIVSTGDIKARYMRRDFFSFPATHKLWMSTNHLPVIRDTDNGIWRRVLPVKFEHRLDAHGMIGTEDGPVTNLKAELHRPEHLAGVLGWLLEGVRQWQAQGLNPPLAVQAWRDEYRSDMDVLGQFLDDACRVLDEDAAPPVAITNTLLWEKFLAWSEGDKVRETLRDQAGLTRALKGRGFRQGRTPTTRFWPKLSNRV